MIIHKCDGNCHYLCTLLYFFLVIYEFSKYQLYKKPNETLVEEAKSGMCMRGTLAFLFSLSISFSPSTQLPIDYRLEASTPVNAFLICQPSLHTFLFQCCFSTQS